eukprot:c1211_g1_i1.p1 GENE.c1211_g1_i1~~c1211_g1_i1.p1  ORF type:complete len:544 (-),score=108.78 c1211_g1_i1:219-1850(-)
MISRATLRLAIVLSLACFCFASIAQPFVKNSETETESHDDEEEEAEAHEHLNRFAVVIACLALAITFVGGYIIEEVLKITVLPEAAFAVIVGAVLSGLFYAGQYEHGEHLDDIIKFDKEFFFVWLLPPIIFEAGYNMNRKAFFDNIVPTILYAFLGTFVSTMIIGGIVYGAGEAGICFNLGLLPSFVFGALVSATDPVTVLAVFQSLGVNVNLFSMVFGESVLNDAVALVLYRTVLGFKDTAFNAASVAAAIGMFSKIFVLSFVIGVVLGMACAYVFKKLDLRHHEHRYMEACLTVVFPWASYFLAETLGLSGIVAILFAGITMSYYAFENLSTAAQELTQQLYKVIAKVAETFVFVYLGMSIFAFQASESRLPLMLSDLKVSLVFVSIFACLVSRVFNIVPCSVLVNIFRKGQPGSMPKISGPYQFLMWWSGLRGGVAFAIAVAQYTDNIFPEDNISLVILQTTLMIALFTIFVFGGAIAKLATYFGVLDRQRPPVVQEEVAPPPISQTSRNSLAVIDRKLKPFLTVSKTKQGHQQLQEDQL